MRLTDAEVSQRIYGGILGSRLDRLDVVRSLCVAAVDTLVAGGIEGEELADPRELQYDLPREEGSDEPRVRRKGIVVLTYC